MQIHCRSVQIRESLAIGNSNSRDARVAEHVVLSLQFGDDFCRLKFAQDLGRPHAMGSAFTHGCIVNAHELERRRN